MGDENRQVAGCLFVAFFLLVFVVVKRITSSANLIIYR
jgi:hypothetical protein